MGLAVLRSLYRWRGDKRFKVKSLSFRNVGSRVGMVAGKGKMIIKEMMKRRLEIPYYEHYTDCKRIKNDGVK